MLSLPSQTLRPFLLLAIFALSSCGVHNPAVEPERSVSAGAIQPSEQIAPHVITREESKRQVFKNALADRSNPAAASVHERADLMLQGQPPMAYWPREPLDRENYAHQDNSPIRRVLEQPVSTFSIDVDTGAYANVRRFLNAGRLPPSDAVRVEEMINYFSYDYPTPQDKRTPFRVTTEMAPTPWNRDSLLLHIGLKAYDVQKDKLPPANLVFLIDVSGSMMAANKLDLLKPSLKLLVQQLRPQDRIGIVVYAGASGVVLAPTAGDQKAKIYAALDALNAGGSTNGGAGIRLAYSLAQQHFIPQGINRVILATDGDFNVGTVNFAGLMDLIKDKRRAGIALTTLGFGSGNYNDHLMEQLADAGNGNYAYIDNLSEAQKVLVSQLGATLHTIAKDVKIQIEFNPSVVAEYRLIGYENRGLKREDFDNDKVDAGDIGAGHTVTALYEITLTGSPTQRLPALRYNNTHTSPAGKKDEIAFIRLRYQAPTGGASKLMQWPLKTSDIAPPNAVTSERFRLAAAVAAFGQLLRGGEYMNDLSYPQIKTLTNGLAATDSWGYVGEFLQLVTLTESLDHRNTTNVSQHD